MKIIAIVIFALLVMPRALSAQEVSVSVGYGTYVMRDLQLVNLQHVTTAPNNVPLKVVSDFPSWPTVGLHFTLPVSEIFEVGVDGLLHSTGSRAAYGDYSGEMYFDQNVEGISVAIVPGVVCVNDEKNLLSLEALSGITFSDLVHSQTRRILDQHSMQRYTYKSLNYFFQPGLWYRRRLGDGPLFLGVQLGYHLLLSKGDFESQDNDGLFLDTYTGRAGANWSGARVNVSIGYRLKIE